MSNLTTTEQRNIQTLSRWYNEMWGQCNADLIPEFVNTHYLRHDMTGANNRLKPEEYQAMTRMGSEGREVEDFTYYLIAEEDYVGALGRYIRDGNDQWDWVQIFRLEGLRIRAKLRRWMYRTVGFGSERSRRTQYRARHTVQTYPAELGFCPYRPSFRG